MGNALSDLETLAEKDAEIDRLKKENKEMSQKLKRFEKERNKENIPLENEIQECPVCSFPYSKKENRMPMVGTCGHTICAQCVPQLRDHRCPICRARDSFSQSSKNFLACQYLEQGILLKQTLVETETVGDTILLLGGLKSPKDYSNAIILTSERSKWIESKLDLPYAAGGSGAVYLNDEIYLFGGWNSPKSLYKLGKKMEWIQLADMNIGRSYITNSCLVWDGCIWVFGGADEHRNCLKSVEKYDPQTNNWSLMPDMKYPRRRAAAVLWNDKIIISGGFTDKLNITNTVECLQDDTWIELPNFPNTLYGHTLLSYKNKLIAIGNGDKENCNNVWKLDPYKNNSKWKPLVLKKNKLRRCSGIVLDEEIYTICGLQGKEHSGVEIFDGKRWRNGPRLPYTLSDMSLIIIPHNFAYRLCNYVGW